MKCSCCQYQCGGVLETLDGVVCWFFVGRTVVGVDPSFQLLQMGRVMDGDNSHVFLEASALYIGGRTKATITATSFTSNKVQNGAMAGAAFVCEQATGV